MQLTDSPQLDYYLISLFATLFTTFRLANQQNYRLPIKLVGATEKCQSWPRYLENIFQPYERFKYQYNLRFKYFKIASTTPIQGFIFLISADRKLDFLILDSKSTIALDCGMKEFLSKIQNKVKELLYSHSFSEVKYIHFTYF